MSKVIHLIIITHHHHFTLPIHPPPLHRKIPPPHSSFPRGGHDNAKRAQKECRISYFCEAVAIGRGGVSDSHPAFFLPIAMTSNKKFLKV
jgi:hypothetical protein